MCYFDKGDSAYRRQELNAFDGTPHYDNCA